ncbi:MAG: DNA gyrase subunit A [bacterium JZ-2024 1]
MRRHPPPSDPTLPFGGNNIRTTVFEEEMRGSFLDYAMSVIIGRALPDVRDGLKPVQVRILYTMYELGLTPNKPTTKCAKITGMVTGNYHPHGDAAVYEALVNMAQEFGMRYPLVVGQGNFGSVDGDPPAAARYTEAKLSPIAMELLEDIDKETVDWRPNYTSEREEPTWLPAKVPNLLMNGSTGIAVGVATNIPPHNLRELCDAILVLLDHPEATLDDILKVLPGPDFPTGGTILGPTAVQKAYAEGRGSLKIRAKAEIVHQRRHASIVITEIPFLVRKADIVERIATLVREKQIEGITDLRDESDKRGIRLVIDIHRDHDPNIILEKLYRSTPLESGFNIILLTLVDGVPRILPIRDLILEFIKHRKVTVRRRTEFTLKKARERLHILEGLLVALANIDRVIKIIRESADTTTARNALMGQFSLSEEQARAILDMRLAALTSLEVSKVKDEQKQLQATAQECEEILGSEKKLISEIRKETREIREKYGDERRSRLEEPREFDLRELIPDEEVVLTLTRLGYIKRVNLDSYRTYGRGAKGLIGMEAGKGDTILDIVVTRTKEFVYAFTKKGKLYALEAWQIFQDDRYGRGRPIANLLSLDPDDEVLHIGSPREDKKYLVLVTRRGKVKRLLFPALLPVRRNGKRIITLSKGDELVDCFWASAEDRLAIVTANARGVTFSLDQNIRLMSRQARGVRGIRVGPEDKVVGATVAPEGVELLIVTSGGYGKRMPAESLREYKNRGGKGVRVYKISPKTGEVLGVKVCRDADEVITITEQGKVARQSLKKIARQSRHARGVRLVTLNPGDRLTNFDLVEITNSE